MKREQKVPDVITAEHIGARVLYRLPNNAIAIEGTIDELSPGGDYVHVGRNWVENGVGAILAVLSAPQRRREAIR